MRRRAPDSAVPGQLPLPFPGDGALAPPSQWLTLFTAHERAAYAAYLKSESQLSEAIETATTDLHAYWRAQDGRVTDVGVAAAGKQALGSLDELYAQRRVVRAMRDALEQDALRRIGQD